MGGCALLVAHCWWLIASILLLLDSIALSVVVTTVCNYYKNN